MIQNKKQQVYEIIKHRILTEEYPLGYKIHIGELSEQLGVSNSPIREAVNLLEKEGLVTNPANSGPSVVEMSEEDWFELAQTLFFWIVSAYRFVVTVEKDKEMCEQMENELEKQKRAYDEGDRYQFTEHACRFDRCIIEATGNHRLIKQFDGMFSLLFLGAVYSQKHEEMDVSIIQHERILELMKENKMRDAVDALAAHYYKPCWAVKEVD